MKLMHFNSIKGKKKFKLLFDLCLRKCLNKEDENIKNAYIFFHEKDLIIN